MREWMNGLRAQAQMATQSRARVRHGVVTHYDPKTYRVRATLQPDGVQTPWMPIKTLYVGNGWGLQMAPSVGDAVEIHYQEDDTEVGSVGLRFYNDTEKNMEVPAAEVWLKHKSGTFFKMRTNGDIEVHCEHDVIATVKGNVTATVDGNVTGTVKQNVTLNVDGNASATVKGNASATVQGSATLAVTGNITSNAAQWNHTGPVTMTGNVTINGNNTVSGTVSGGTVKQGGVILGSHTHGGVSSGGSNTAGPN